MNNPRYAKDAALLGIAFVVIVLQSSVITRIAWPLHGPNLILLLFIPWVLSETPFRAALIGFLMGGFIDLAPPGNGPVGQWALAMTLIGFGLATYAERSRDLVQSPLVEVGIFALGALALLLTWGILGLMVGDDRASAKYFFQFIPSSLLWNVVLAPFVLPVVRKTTFARRVRR
ncbi:MAG: rod shape-determining protein MreD [Actinobacteria bacterium]|nr:rod shape-determining protein MreD [Actinomycetota bacterium]